jgi:hypothetical protein
METDLLLPVLLRFQSWLFCDRAFQRVKRTRRQWFRRPPEKRRRLLPLSCVYAFPARLQLPVTQQPKATRLPQFSCETVSPVTPMRRATLQAKRIGLRPLFYANDV